MVKPNASTSFVLNQTASENGWYTSIKPTENITIKAITAEIYRRETKNLGISFFAITCNLALLCDKITIISQFHKIFTTYNVNLPQYTCLHHKSRARMDVVRIFAQSFFGWAHFQGVQQTSQWSRLWQAKGRK